VKLLFDANLSHKLVGILARDFPGCSHVRNLGLRAAEDGQIWDHAREQSLMIVSKDADFRDRSYVEGFPPKIIWLDVGNAGTAAIAELLRRERHRAFELLGGHVLKRPQNGALRGQARRRGR
jgi:predicted nuclease of predicted toxin-antitoxin system